MPSLAAVVDHQMRTYYDRRADEYDEWWLGSGSFAGRPRVGWREEVTEIVALVSALEPARTLDVACGTGFLTRHLRGEVVGIDQSAAMTTIARRAAPHARIVCGEAVPLPFPDRAFDAIFTSHFYGHLLPPEREQFLSEAARLAPRLFVVDAALREDVEEVQWQARQLNDGSRHRIYKRYFRPQQLAAELGGGIILYAGQWFVAVSCELSPRREPVPPRFCKVPR